MILEVTNRKKILLAGLAIIAIVGIGFGYQHVRLYLSRSGASGGPDEALLYGQNLAPGYSADELAKPDIQSTILARTLANYSKPWVLDQLESIQDSLPPFPPTRASLWFQQFLKGPSSGIKAPVEGGSVSIIINQDGKSDDILSDNFIPEIKAQDPVLTMTEASQKIALPLDAVISESDLVYHFGKEFMPIETATPLPSITSIPAEPSKPQGLMGCWALDGNAKDGSGNNNDGILVGSPEPDCSVSGKHGTACSFSGIGPHIKIPAAPSLDVGKTPGNSATIEAWIKPSGAKGQPLI